MATASGILSTIAPQFDAEATRQDHLDLAESRTSSTYYGANRPEAVALRAAHELTLAAPASLWADGVGGNVTTKKEGDLQVSFGSKGPVSASDADLAQTRYGMRLSALMRSRPASQVTGVPFVSGSLAYGRSPWV